MRNVLTTYRGVVVGKGSQLAQALADNDKRAAARIFDETTARFDAIYPKGDRQWFENWSDTRDLARLVPEGVIELSTADAALLLGLQENPSEPNSALQRAFARYKERA